MNITHNKSASAFFLDGDKGKLVYSMEADNLIIEHTEVDDVMKGKGAGKQLVTSVVEYARTNHLKIIPLCSFAKAVLEKGDEFQDVL